MILSLNLFAALISSNSLALSIAIPACEDSASKISISFFSNGIKPSRDSLSPKTIHPEIFLLPIIGETIHSLYPVFFKKGFDSSSDIIIDFLSFQIKLNGIDDFEKMAPLTRSSFILNDDKTESMGLFFCVFKIKPDEAFSVETDRINTSVESSLISRTELRDRLISKRV